MTSQFIFGHRWYRTLVPKEDSKWSLMDRYGTDHAFYAGKLLVCLTLPEDITRGKGRGGEDGPNRLFALFGNDLEFARYQNKYFPASHRFFYEVILGSLPQKHYFDLEDSNTADKSTLALTLIAVINGIQAVYEEKGWNLSLEQDLLIYSSHGSEKQSYHVVVTNHCCSDHKENRAFHDLVKAKVPPHLQGGMDSKVYSSCQQLRILGSRKAGSERVKIYYKDWDHHGKVIHHIYTEDPESPDHETLLQTEESLIGITRNCQLLPPLITATPTRVYEASEDLLPETVHSALRVMNGQGDSPYRYIGTRGAFILLRRIRPEMCPLCHRIHEHENPFLSVKELADGRHIYFHCRRADAGQKFDMGVIPKEVVKLTIDLPSIVWEQDVLGKLQQMKLTLLAQYKDPALQVETREEYEDHLVVIETEPEVNEFWARALEMSTDFTEKEQVWRHAISNDPRVGSALIPDDTLRAELKPDEKERIPIVSSVRLTGIREGTFSSWTNTEAESIRNALRNNGWSAGPRAKFLC